MADAIIKGSTAATPKPGSEEWDNGTIRETTIYEGPTAAIDTLYIDSINTDPSRRVSNEHFEGWSRLTIEFESTGADGVVDTRYELDTTLLRKDLRTFPPFQDVDTLCVRDVELAIQKNTPWNEIPWNTPGCLVTWENELKQYYYHRQAGVRSWLYVAYVARKVQIVKRTATVTASHTGVHSVQPLPTDFPTILVGSLPSEIEWLKQAPKLRGTGDKNYEMSQEWWGGTPQWSQWLYGGSWDPTAGG